MQIEKPKIPKSTLPPGAIFLVLVATLLILSLPFWAESARSKTVSPEDRQITETAEAIESKPSNLAVKEIPAEVSVPPQIPEKPQSVAAEVSASQIKSTSVATDKSPAAMLTSFHGDVRVVGADGAQKDGKSRQILKNETIEVGATGEAVLEIEELYVLRLKPNTKLTQLESRTDEAFSGKERTTYRFKLDQGALLGTTKYRGDKTSMLDLVVKDKVFNVQDSTFRVELSDAAPWIGVLRGNVKSNLEAGSDKALVIHALEKIPLDNQPVAQPIRPVKVSKEEWGLLRETYEMNVKTAAEEAKQIDLSKRAGDFFEYVFDHGTFYTENVGYTVRDFYEDKMSGTVYLEAEYDVFPSNSFVGLYVLTRDLDAKNYGGIRFDVRRKPEEGYPDRFYVEIKSKGQIIHRFEITDVKPEWESRQIEFFTPQSTPITEVTLVFLNETIGQTKKGFIQMRNVQMIPLTPDQKAAVEEAAKNPIPAKIGAVLPQAPRSVKQAAVTEPIKKAKKVVMESETKPVPYKTDSSRKIAKETPKVVSLEDL